jgi:pyruvate/2-oxoglutarate dehydrogenase complex dihydrolipoamide dehydrogenase (E3) component
VGPRTIEAELTGGGTRTFRGKNVVINTGSRASLEPIGGLAEVGPLTHIEALELDEIPEHLLVLGAGYVGLELAQAFRRFGADVTLIDRNSRLAHHEDEDISQGLEEMCRDEGINVVTNAIVTLVKASQASGSGSSASAMELNFPWQERICWLPEAVRQIPAVSGSTRQEWRRPSGVT